MKKYFLLLTMIVSCMTLSLTFTSCGDDSSDEPSVDTTPITISCGKSMDISKRGSNFTTANKFVASVTDGTLKANHIGSTMITSNGHSIPVTVTRTVSYIDEPCTTWGASMSEVRKAQKSGHEIEPYTGASNVIMYAISTSSGKNKYIYSYQFENGKLTSSSFLAPVSDVNTLTDWLSERFFMLPISSTTNIAAGGYDGYDKASATTACAISSETVSNSYYNMYTKYNYLVMYMPANK